MARRRRSLEPNQRGLALIMLISILAMGGLYFFVSQFNSVRAHQDRDLKTAQALKMAKEALIAWSVMSTTAPGQLPCPEDTSLIGMATEGQAMASCGNTLRIGRLPWKTLKVGDLRDGYGEPLWYALSPGFRTVPINSATPAQLTLDGTGSAVAIVFSPGPPLAGQTRPAISAAVPPAVANYLDLSNGSGSTAFASTGSPETFNDTLLAINSQDLFSAVTPRLAGDLRGYPGKGLQGYMDIHGYLPCAATAASAGLQVALTPTGLFPYNDPDMAFDTATNNRLANNNWFGILTYSAPDCGTATAMSATITIGSKIVSLRF